MSNTLVAPASGVTTWTIDPAHSSVEFGVRHLMISTVKGRFGAVQGTVDVDDTTGQASVDVTIDATSIDTRNAQRDAHLRSPDFFAAETHPSLRFIATQVEGDLGGRFTLTGDLTIRDITRTITLDVTAEGNARDPWGGERASYAATARINRGDWGLTWNQALETGGVVVSDEVRLSLDVQLVKGA
jgi:polyisoprenoid-binding protein YceI